MGSIKKNVDEREELELLRIEHVCFWLLFWGLFISLIVQSLFMQAPFAQFAPEWILFMLTCAGIGIGCLRKGLWDFYTTPSFKTYFIASLLTTVIMGIVFGIAKYRAYEVFRQDITGMLLPTILIFSSCIFILTFGALFVTGKLTMQRRKKLEDKYRDLH